MEHKKKDLVMYVNDIFLPGKKKTTAKTQHNLYYIY